MQGTLFGENATEIMRRFIPADAGDTIRQTLLILFEGRIPFLGSNNTKHWLETLQQLETTNLQALVPGHGPADEEPAKAITLTREYLAFMREEMGKAVEDFVQFDEAYDNVDWTRFESLPAFESGNRGNAYRVYVSLEAEGVD